MHVLLTLTALFQRAIDGKPEYCIDSAGNERRHYYDFDCAVQELMKATGIKREGRLVRSLERLGSVQIQFQRADGKKQGELTINGLFSFSIKRVDENARRTRKDDRLIMSMHRAFIPRAAYLYRSAGLCRKLSRDSSRLIFWVLCSRTHLKATAEEWKAKLCSGQPRKKDGLRGQKLLWDWEHKSFKPALEELKAAGFDVREEKNYMGKIMYYVSVPRRSPRKINAAAHEISVSAHEISAAAQE